VKLRADVGSWEDLVRREQTMAQTAPFTVTGDQKIHCAGCEERITNSLRRLLGIQDVQASHETQRVAVTFDPALVSPDKVTATLEQLGYKV